MRYKHVFNVENNLHLQNFSLVIYNKISGLCRRDPLNLFYRQAKCLS